LRIIRTFVETVARQMGFDEENVAQIEMAVDEACSNVLLHAYPKQEGQETEVIDPPETEAPADVIVRLIVDSRGLAISIIDRGIGDIDGPHDGIQSIEEYCDLEGDYHGLGTYIIRSFMDEVEYHFPQEKGTVVRMRKFLNRKREEN